MTKLLSQQPEGGRAGQQIVRPQGGAAVALQPAVLSAAHDAVPVRNVVASLAPAAHHVQVSLDADQGRLLQAGCGGEVAAEIPKGVGLDRAAHGLEQLGERVSQRCLPA